MHQYTTGEEAMIRERWGEVSPKVLADELGVSEEALVRHARRMGLRLTPGRGGMVWKDHEDKALRLLASFGATDRQIADALHRGERSVKRRRQKIGA